MLRRWKQYLLIATAILLTAPLFGCSYLKDLSRSPVFTGAARYARYSRTTHAAWDATMTVRNRHNEPVPYAVIKIDQIDGEFLAGPDGMAAILIPEYTDRVSGTVRSHDGTFHTTFAFGVSRDPSRNNYTVRL